MNSVLTEGKLLSLTLSIICAGLGRTEKGGGTKLNRFVVLQSASLHKGNSGILCVGCAKYLCDLLAAACCTVKLNKKHSYIIP